MGASTMFDIVSSTVIAGLLFLMVIRLSAQANETTLVYHSNLMVQQNMIALVGVIEHDFRRIGYCGDPTRIDNPTEAIRLADSTSIRFWTDADNNKSLDSIYYYLGATDEGAVAETQNPRDRILYRQTNADPPLVMQIGVTQFRLKYFDSFGDSLIFPIDDPRSVHTMEISMAVESPAPYRLEYTAVGDTLADFQVFWRQLRLAARNLRNR
jgi:hypothetical protein